MCSSCGGNDNDMCYQPVCTVFLLDECGNPSDQPDTDNCAPICQPIDPCIKGVHICQGDGDRQAQCSFDGDRHECAWQCECSEGFERSEDGQSCTGGSSTTTQWATTTEEASEYTTEAP
jgi:hypothetical protein